MRRFEVILCKAAARGCGTIPGELRIGKSPGMGARGLLSPRSQLRGLGHSAMNPRSLGQDCEALMACGRADQVVILRPSGKRNVSSNLDVGES